MSEAKNGWKLVPVEPTEEMIRAAAYASLQIPRPKWDRPTLAEILTTEYRAAINAAPQAPQQEAKGEAEDFDLRSIQSLMRSYWQGADAQKTLGAIDKVLSRMPAKVEAKGDAGEPVAWLYRIKEGDARPVLRFKPMELSDPYRKVYDEFPLVISSSVAHPPARVALTDEEIDDIWHRIGNHQNSHRTFAQVLFSVAEKKGQS